MGKNTFTEREENYVQLEELSKIILSNSVRKGNPANTMHFCRCFGLHIQLSNIVFFLSTTWQTGGCTENLYEENIERVSGLYSYALGQVVASLFLI